MNRFETIIVAVAAFSLGAIYSPAFAQKVIFDGGKDGDGVAKGVSVETKGKSGKASLGKGPPAPAPALLPASPKEPTFTATGGFESTREKARDSAIRVAAEQLHDRLANEHGIRRQPTTEMVRKMLLNDQEKVTESDPIINPETGKTETMYRITVAVRVEDEHVRELRSRERSSEALWVLAGLGGLAGMIAVFFRVDTWTKGYLTSWLMLGTVGTATLLAGLWWLAK
jgi:hypothetical protein